MLHLGDSSVEVSLRQLEDSEKTLQSAGLGKRLRLGTVRTGKEVLRLKRQESRLPPAAHNDQIF